MHYGLLLGIELFDSNDDLIASTLNYSGEVPLRQCTLKATDVYLEKGERLLGITCSVMVHKKMMAANYDLRFVIGKLEN